MGGIDDASVEDVIQDVRRHFGPELRFVYRHNPLDDPGAEQAAMAIEAVSAQSRDLFPLMRQELNRLCMDEELDRNIVRRAAVDMGANLTGLEVAMRQQLHAGRVHDDSDDAKTLGLDTSPVFFVNDEIYEGPIEADDTIAALEATRPARYEQQHAKDGRNDVTGANA